MDWVGSKRLERAVRYRVRDGTDVVGSIKTQSLRKILGLRSPVRKYPPFPVDPLVRSLVRMVARSVRDKPMVLDGSLSSSLRGEGERAWDGVMWYVNVPKPIVDVPTAIPLVSHCRRDDGFDSRDRASVRRISAGNGIHGNENCDQHVIIDNTVRKIHGGRGRRCLDWWALLLFAIASESRGYLEWTTLCER